MYKISRFANLAAAALVCILAGVSSAGANTLKVAADGCRWQIEGAYGTLSYPAEDVSPVEKVKGTYSLVFCDGLFISFDGGLAIEAGEFFTSQDQLDWFLSDVKFIAVDFYEVDSMRVDAAGTKFVLGPRYESIGNSPTSILLRKPDSLATGIAFTAKDGTLTFLNVESINSSKTF